MLLQLLYARFVCGTKQLNVAAAYYSFCMTLQLANVRRIKVKRFEDVVEFRKHELSECPVSIP
jgi:hypothetical protein